MLQDVINLPDQQQHHRYLADQECLSSPTVNQILDFCDDSELFPETLRTSEVSSCSGGGNGSGCGEGRDISSRNICCYDEASLTSPFSPLLSMDASVLVSLLDAVDLEPTMTTNINYSSPLPPPSLSPSISTGPMYLSNNPNNQFNQTELVDDILNGYTMVCTSDSAIAHHLTVATPQLLNIPPQLPPPTVFDNDCIATPPVYIVGGRDPSSASCSFMDQTGTGMGMFFSESLGLSGENMYPGSLLMATDRAMQMQDLAEYHSECGGEMGFFGAVDTCGQQRIYTSNDMQVMSDGQHLNGGNCGSPTPLTSDMSSLDESSFKVGRLSVEERKEKIHRYLKKRNERNFSKKIKYACRKTLADSRPRVRGRFAKNDELGETTRLSSNNHDDEDDEDVVIKEEDIMDSSDIFAHLNSFKCNYTLEPWIS